jgi:hypothetical protein
MQNVDVKWKYAALGLGGLVVIQFFWWNQRAPGVLNLNIPRLPLLG